MRSAASRATRRPMRTCATTPSGRSCVEADRHRGAPQESGASNRWREIAGVIAAMALVLLAYREVAFAGKTFDTSAMTNGVNSFDHAHPPNYNAFRVDPGASAWQMRPWANVVHTEIARGVVPMWT